MRLKHIVRAGKNNDALKILSENLKLSYTSVYRWMYNSKTQIPKHRLPMVLEIAKQHPDIFAVYTATEGEENGKEK